MQIKNIIKLFSIFAITNSFSVGIDFVNHGSENFSVFSPGIECKAQIVLKPGARRNLDLNYFQIVPSTVFKGQLGLHNFYANFFPIVNDKLDPIVIITQDESGNSYLQSPIFYAKTASALDPDQYTQSIYSVVEFHNNTLKTVRIMIDEGGRLNSQLVHPDGTVKVLINADNNQSGITVLPEYGISPFVRYYDIPLQKRIYKIDLGYLYSKEPLEISREFGTL